MRECDYGVVICNLAKKPDKFECCYCFLSDVMKRLGEAIEVIIRSPVPADVMPLAMSVVNKGNLLAVGFLKFTKEAKPDEYKKIEEVRRKAKRGLSQ